MSNLLRTRGEAWPGEDSLETTGHTHSLSFLWRIYALVPIVVVLVLSFGAIRYLFVSLLYPYDAPVQVTAIPKRLTDEMLRTEPAEWVGQMLVDTPRTPLAHYHRIDGWFQPDPSNDCTSAGCHSPMPHGQRKEVRAFLNMHATSIHCGVCHIKSDDYPLPLVWYDLQDGRVADTPALLQAHGWLDSDEGRVALANPTAADQERLVGLLRLAASEAGDDPTLARLANEVHAERFTSEGFQAAVEVARNQVPLHFRGEYGAKLALRDTATGQPILVYPGAAAAADEFLRRRGTLSEPDRAALLVQVHPPRRAELLACHACHQEGESLVDLKIVGYPLGRIRALREGWIFRAIEDIAAGQPLHLPEFVLPDGLENVESAPSSDHP
ncbi:MAG: hypothetical protein ABIG44_04000 [Planctomycetota bacterium]